MKGIILAGWNGTRLYPLTKVLSKQLMPIYDKPMIYYPVSTLMIAGIKDILIITTSHDLESFKKLLWDGSQWWISLSYKVQESPDWLAQAFIIGKEFIWKDDVCLVLGDNIFYGQGFWNLLRNTTKKIKNEKESVIFGYEVADPKRYWVVEFNESKKAISLEEKPEFPKSNYAVVWLYFYPNDVIVKAWKVRPSERWELEITSINEMYLQENRLKVEIMNRWYAWLDTGTHKSMLEASNFIEIIEKRQWLKISCPEEIAWLNWWINSQQVIQLAEPLKKSNYGKYLLKRIKK